MLGPLPNNSSFGMRAKGQEVLGSNQLIPLSSKCNLYIQDKNILDGYEHQQSDFVRLFGIQNELVLAKPLKIKGKI